MQLIISQIEGVPLINPGEDLGLILGDAINCSKISMKDQDIIVITQKIVSKAEGRLVNLIEIEPSGEAKKIAKIAEKDPRFVELVLRESRTVLRVRPGTIITEHLNGFICANAGIDHSNVKGSFGNQEDWYLLLPEHPDFSAQIIRKKLEEFFKIQLGVLIIDSHGRAWRTGTTGSVIGISGVPGLIDLRGHADLFGYKLRVTQVAAGDELAAAASLMMGQATEGIPAVHVRGFPYQARESHLGELLRPKDQDLFR
jgi:coenzyme F420-0:L-glutamate ligase / coenzyme F420-1:gamma-L-glutamate ligase